MVSQKVRVKNPSGLHLRPAGVLCSTALQFKCRVRFTFREATVNAKSVLSVLGACVKEGDEKKDLEKNRKIKIFRKRT